MGADLCSEGWWVHGWWVPFTGVSAPRGSISACPGHIPPCPACLHVGVALALAREGGHGKDCLASAADICPLSLSICPARPSQADLCSPSDLLQGTAQGLRTTLEAVSWAGGKSPPPVWPPSGLGGFVLFYVVLMLLLYVVYIRLLGS
jgi:hypothetical protein